MKHSSIAGALLVLASLSFVQCSKDEDPDLVVQTLSPPTLSASVTGAVQGKFLGVVAGADNGEVKGEVNIEASAGFASLQIHKVQNGTKVLISEIAEGDASHDGLKALSHKFSYKLTKEDTGKDFEIQAVAADKKGQKTATTKLVDVSTRAPLSSFSPTLTTTYPVAGLVKTHHYLLADNLVYSASLGDIVTDQSFGKVELIFSANEVLGFYLASPSAVSEEPLLVKFKNVNLSGVRLTNLTAAEFNAIGKSSTHEVEALFANTPEGSHPGRATGLGAGKVVSFKTHDLRTGVLLVKSLKTNTIPDPDETSIEVSLWISEKPSI